LSLENIILSEKSFLTHKIIVPFVHNIDKEYPIMFNSKLLSILDTFEKKELKQCHALILSPFFNKNESLIKLYEYCVKSYPDFKSARFKRETVYKKLFPTQTFDDANMRYLMSDLTKLLEQFLVQQALKEAPNNQMELLLEAKLKRKLYPFFKTTFKKQQTKIGKSPIRDATYFHHQFEIFEKLATIEFLTEDNRGDIKLIEKAENYLDIFYIATKLKYACLVQNFKLLVSAEYDPIFTQRILEYAESTDLIKSNVLIYSYYLAYKMRVSEEEEDGNYFNLLTKQMEESSNIFQVDKAQNLYAYLRNFCIRKINQGQSSQYYDKLLNIYKMQLDDESLFFPNKYLSQSNYKNIYHIGVLTDKIEFSEAFIKEYRSRLNPEDEKSIYAYAYAYLVFNKGNYDNTLVQLNTVNVTKSYDYLATKILLIKTYYQLNQIDTLESSINALDIYIKRNKEISKFQKTSHTNFVAYMKKLLRLKFGRKVDVSKLKEDFKNEKNCAEARWLTLKINSLQSP